MLSIRQAIRIMRAVATAIREQNLEALASAIEDIAEAVGLDKELAELRAVYEAFKSGDYAKMVDALSSLLDLISQHLGQPRPFGTSFGGVDQSPEFIASKLDSEANHWMKHSGVAGSLIADPPETAATAKGVSPAVVLMILEAILTAVRWWRDRRTTETD